MNRLFIPLFILVLSLAEMASGQDFRIIDATIANEKHKLSEIADDEYFVRLETNENCMISYIYRIIQTKDYFFILSANDLYMFDKQGGFVRKIGTEGNGPGEYVNIWAIAVNEANETVYIASRSKLLSFDYDGEFQKTIPFKRFVECMEVMNGELYAICTDLAVRQSNGTFSNITKLYRLNDNLSVTDSIDVKYINLASPAGGMSRVTRYFSDLGDKQYMFFPVLTKDPIVRDTLYSIEGNKLKPDIKVNFKKASKDGENFMMRNMYRSKSFLFAEYTYTGQKYFFCYDLEKELTMNMEEGFNDDILNTGVAKLEPLDPANGLMYFVKQANEVTDVIDGVDEFDNPVIIFVQLKE